MHKVMFLNDYKPRYFIGDCVIFKWMVVFTSRANTRYLLLDNLFGISALSSGQFLKIHKIKKVLPKIYILPQDNGHVPFVHMYIVTTNHKLKPVLGEASPIFNLTH